jgi:hypothetical protein
MSEQSETQTIFRFVTVRSPKKRAERKEPQGLEMGVRKELQVIESESLEDDYDGFYPADGRVRIRPLGIADFRRVEQTLCCYRPGEVAHIENILQGEYKERSTRRLRRTEDTVTQSTEKSSETERDTTTADRHEMQSEAAKTLQQNTALSIGVSVAGSYGPVSANLNTQFSSSTASSESDRQAVLYAQEVTNRSLERIIEKVRTERISKLTEEFEENNKHGLDNRAGNQHVVGIYRWVDKIYEAKVVNYGKRLMFEFLLPEPAAFHLWAMSQASAAAPLEMEKPIDPRSQAATATILGAVLSNPRAITQENYSVFAGYYGAIVTPPPAAIQTIEMAYAADQLMPAKPFAQAKNDLKIPEGYQPVRARIISGMSMGWISVGVGNDGVFIDCVDGSPNNKALPKTIELNLQNEIGTLPVTICGATDMYAINISVTCAVTQTAMEGWQLKTFQAIIEAYENKHAQYQQAVAEAQAQNGVTIQGTNPAMNRAIEQQELKKGCLKWLFNSAHFGSVATSYARTAPDDWSNAGAQCPTMEMNDQTIAHAYQAKFMEQAFEWGIMTYSFYPYFWGKEERWRKLYQLNDTDPIFLNFLQAGMARVVVPVQPGFENQVLSFLHTGQLWNQKEVPNNPLYECLMEDLERIHPVEGKPWEIRVPTALTILQTASGAIDANGLPCGCASESAIGLSTGAVLTAGKP